MTTGRYIRLQFDYAKAQADGVTWYPTEAKINIAEIAFEDALGNEFYLYDDSVPPEDSNEPPQTPVSPALRKTASELPTPGNRNQYIIDRTGSECDDGKSITMICKAKIPDGYTHFYGGTQAVNMMAFLWTLRHRSATYSKKTGAYCLVQVGGRKLRRSCGRART